MLALQGISILIAILVPESISINTLQLLTNTFNGWWQMGDFRVNWNGLLWGVRDGGSTYTSPLEDGPSTTALVFSTLWAGAEAQAVPWVPHPPGCRPRGSLQRPEGRRKKTSNLWTINLVKAVPACEQGADCRLKVWMLAHPTWSRKCAPTKHDVEFEIASCCKYTRGLPCKEILWHNHSYSQESFCEMSTGVFSLKQI